MSSAMASMAPAARGRLRAATRRLRSSFSFSGYDGSSLSGGQSLGSERLLALSALLLEGTEALTYLSSLLDRQTLSLLRVFKDARER